MKSEQKLLTPKEVAKGLDVSVDWVHNHATRKNPHLPVVRIGKLVDRPHDFAAFGGDDIAFPTFGLRTKARRLRWVTLFEQKWVILAERRGAREKLFPMNS
jgi:hypothetical protein